MSNSYWTKIETITKSAYNNPKDIYTITKYWRPNIKLTDTEFIINGGINHTDGGKGVVLLAADTDYSKPGSGEYTKSASIAGVFGSFDREGYWSMINQFLKGQGAGSTADGSIGLNKNTNEWEFCFYWDEESANNVATLSFADGWKLFHEYFNTFKRFVEEYNPEFMEKERPSLKGNFKVWPLFVEQLDCLNKHYDELVAKGEIKE